MKNYHFLFFQWLKRDLDGRYRGSLLGLAWPVVQPLVQTAVFTLVLHHFMKFRWIPDDTSSNFSSSNQQLSDTAQYALNVLCGLTVFNFFSEIFNKSPSIVLSQPNLVTKVRFPLLILPLTAVGSSLVAMLAATALLWLVALFHGTPLSQLLLFPVWLLPIVTYGIAISVAFSAIGVFLRDLPQIIPSFVSLLFFITPIFYPTSAIPDDLKFLIHLNPIAWGIDSLRLITLTDKSIDMASLISNYAVSLLSFILAVGIFLRLREGFSDVI